MARRLHAVSFGVALVIAGAFPATAMADGLPIPGVYTDPGGVAAPSGNEHYVTRRGNDDSTLVRALGENGHALRSTTLSGRWVIPAVALDGSPGGLSADETTLVLIQPRTRFPQRETHLALLDAQSLAPRNRLTLRGDFSFDAISPDGSHIYLIQYLSRDDPTKYAVRAYDAVAGTLLPEPIVDPDEAADEMRGYPLTRAASPDGRWAYTLYDGGGKHPFVHALDTLEGQAVCIDLPDFAHQGANNGQLRISSDGGHSHPRPQARARCRNRHRDVRCEQAERLAPGGPGSRLGRWRRGVVADRVSRSRDPCRHRSALRVPPAPQPPTRGDVRQAPERRNGSGLILGVLRGASRSVPLLAVLAVWAGYCVAVSVIGASDHFELTLFLTFIPAQLALGLLVPRWPSALAPVLLTIPLGWLAYQAACPCSENGVGFFYALWTLYFALPGALLVGAAGGLRRRTLAQRDSAAAR